MRLEWQLVGALAMLMIEASYVPQIYKLYRDKNAEDFSIFFPLLNAGGRGLGVLYTGMNGDLVIAMGFVLGIVLRVTLLTQVWYYKRMRQLGFSPLRWRGSLFARWWGPSWQPKPTLESPLSTLVPQQQGTDLLLQPALCYADSCKPKSISTLKKDIVL